MFASGPPPGARRTAAAAEGSKERLLFILAAVVALGLTAWLSYPVWRNQGAELPPEALSAKDQAVSLLRRDDAASRQLAIEQLGTLVGRHPKFTEAQAELVVALSLHLDDVKVELEWIDTQQRQLDKQISALQLAKSPADWKSRVNVLSEELAALGAQKRPLQGSVTELTKQLEKSLGVIRAAPETEPAADVVARVKAQAVYEGVQGTPQALALAERLRKLESPPHWSALSRAEYGLNARSPPGALPELVSALQQVREEDKTFLRAYMLGARLALRQQDRATAQSLLDTVVALNPNHTLARQLQKWAASPALGP
jgi:hypothetical protein